MTAILAQDIAKGYNQYASPVDSLKELLLRRPLHNTFWALRGVSFRHAKGQTLGVIGDNGAGKSSLLKIIAGSMRPTSGRLEVKGRVSAILELGTGFHPEFSGLENIRVGCAMLGLDARETAELLPSIVEFSELGDFIERPVKTYSSGMYVRLAFSVVTSVDPDVLVVDEALSVGDQHFQKKSMNRMMAFREQGKALVFCSHNLYHIKELCQSAIWLDRGVVQAQGAVGEVVDAYQDHVRQQNRASVLQERKQTGSPSATEPKPETPPTPSSKQPASLTAIRLEGCATDAEGKPIYRTHERFAVSVAAITRDLPLDDIHIGIVITRNDGVQCYGVSTAVDNVLLSRQANGELGIRYVIDRLPLLSGEYFLEIWLIDATSVHVYDSRNPCCPFRVRQPGVEVGMAYLPHRWEGITSSD